MQRTQVYLTEEEYRALKALSRQSGNSFAAVLREAIDAYISGRAVDIRKVVEESHGCWQGRTGKSDLRAIRREWGVRESRNK